VFIYKILLQKIKRHLHNKHFQPWTMMCNTRQELILNSIKY